MEENETVKPRKLDELLELDTYQGMTDEEIVKVLAFRAAQAAASAELVTRERAREQQQQAIRDITRAAAERAAEQFARACEAAPEFKLAGEADGA